MAAQIGGFPTDWFVGNVEDFVCGICMDVADNPHQCKKGHFYCQVCMSKVTRCPSCAISVSANEISCNLLAKNQIAGLEVHCVCDWKETKCTWTGPMSSRATRKCDFMIVACTNAGCKHKLQLKNLEQHVKKDCEWRTTRCACGQDVPLPHLNEHKTSTCPLIAVPCALHHAGCCTEKCAQRFPQRDLDKHFVQETTSLEVRRKVMDKLIQLQNNNNEVERFFKNHPSIEAQYQYEKDKKSIFFGGLNLRNLLFLFLSVAQWILSFLSKRVSSVADCLLPRGLRVVNPTGVWVTELSYWTVFTLASLYLVHGVLNLFFALLFRKIHWLLLFVLCVAAVLNGKIVLEFVRRIVPRLLAIYRNSLNMSFFTGNVVVVNK
jgi:hypothetical protein